MSKPVIAFDFDDVIVSTGQFLIQHYNELHHTDVKPDEFYSKDYENVWHADPETATRDLFAFLLTDSYANLPPMPGAVDTLTALAQKFSQVIVTGRPDETEQATNDWIEKYLPNIFDRTVFTNFFKLGDSRGALRTKAEVCKELGARWLVDDHLHHIKNVTDQGVTGILFGDLPWEQPAEDFSGLVKIKNWKQLNEYFDRMVPA